MSGSPQPPYDPLGRLVSKTVDHEKLKRDGWRYHRILVVSVDDERLGWTDREFIRQIGNRLYSE